MTIENFEPQTNSPSNQNTSEILFNDSFDFRPEASAAQQDLVPELALSSGDEVAQLAQANELPPQPTELELQEMVDTAAEGRLNQTAQTHFLRSLLQHGPEGLNIAQDQLNAALEAQDSDFRASIATSGDGLNILIFLETEEERGEEIIEDFLRNGENSQYAERFIPFRLVPMQRPREQTPIQV